MDVDVRRIRADEGQRLKRTRLAAISDSPSAFAQTLMAARHVSDQEWSRLAALRAHSEDEATFFAESNGETLGMVGAHRAGDAGFVELVAMWIDPAHRRRGVARVLVDAVVSWAGEQDAREVQLWVTLGNTPAVQLYRSMGFVLTGISEPLPSDPSHDQARMVRTLW